MDQGLKGKERRKGEDQGGEGGERRGEGGGGWGIFEIVRGIEMDVPIPTNYCGIRRREKRRKVFFGGI